MPKTPDGFYRTGFIASVLFTIAAATGTQVARLRRFANFPVVAQATPAGGAAPADAPMPAVAAPIPARPAPTLGRPAILVSSPEDWVNNRRGRRLIDRGRHVGARSRHRCSQRRSAEEPCRQQRCGGRSENMPRSFVRDFQHRFHLHDCTPRLSLRWTNAAPTEGSGRVTITLSVPNSAADSAISKAGAAQERPRLPGSEHSARFECSAILPKTQKKDTGFDIRCPNRSRIRNNL